MIKTLNYIILVFFIANSVASQKINLSQGKINQKSYYEEVNFELVMQKIIIPVTINNNEYKFLLDTGAPNLISNTVYEALKTSDKQNILILDANNKSQEMSLVAVNSIKINGLNFENTVAVLSDLNNHPLLKCFKIDGFIGSNLLQNSIVKISLKNKKIILTDDIRKLKTKAKPTKLKLVQEQKSPFIELELAGKNNVIATEYALLDTGMDGFYDISNRANAVFQKEEILTQIAQSSGVSGIGLFGVNDEKEQQLMQVNKMKINSTSFENIITETTDDDNSRIGLDLLKYGDIIIDFKNKKFYFEAENDITLNEKPPVISTSFKDNKIIVGHVWNKEYQKEINFGDEIIRLNNYNFKEMNICDIMSARQIIKSNPSYEMEILRKDNTTFILKIEN
ncbi:retropepsin-like aspartic protease [Flavobacterium sp.]|uniref:retropepsin-like aspartic protease n=1 Tax=Flavobacterium sp. TaxID=239 RepID=UPI00261D85B7|nr:retropepsin-like aspartic protease [Flavobacterium sp.]